MTVLIDTSALLAFAFSKDKNHEIASRTMQSLSGERRVVAAPVLTELFYLTSVRISYERAHEIFAQTRAAFEIYPLNEPVMARMQEIMEQYRDATFDLTDTAIMALSEHLNVRRVFTFDRRDFSIFRPAHSDYLELVP